MKSIIIPTYLNSPKTCIESVAKYTDLGPECELIIVANGAPPETREIMNMGIPLKMLWFDEPIGFAKACNAGIKESVGSEIVLLNDDCELLPQEKNHWLNLLSGPFSDPKVGITGSHKLWSEDAQHEFIIFFCAMLRRSMLDDVGLLDESFSPFYGEDISYTIEAERKGWKWVQVPVGEECRLETIPNTEHLPEWKQSRWVGNFPVSHSGEETLGQLPNHVEIVERNKVILRQRYSVNIERAKNIEGWMGHDELLWLATQAKTRNVIVEIGSHNGRSTRAFADNTEGVIYAVDEWADESVLQQFYANLWEHIESGKVRPIRMSSELAAKTLPIKADLVFLDADHEYPSIKADIMNWLPVLAEDGLLCGHDYSIDFPGVVQAVNELLVSYVPPNTGIWVATDQKTVEPTQKKQTVTVEVSTLNRLTTTLPATIASIATQTRKPERFVLYDDGEQKELRGIAPYTELFQLLEQVGIEIETFTTPRLGLAANHQHALENAKTDLLFRVDDDIVLEPDTIEKLLKMMEDETIGAVAPLVLNPSQVQPLPQGVEGKVEDIFNGINLQWFTDGDQPRETEHLYSAFMFRVSLGRKAGGYPTLSPVSFREDSWFSMKLKRAGGRLVVDPTIRVWHLQQATGGVRAFSDGSLWAQDNEKFLEWLASIDIEDKSPKLLCCDFGIGDHWAFKGILPQLKERFKERGMVIAIAHEGILEDEGVPLISIAEARQRLGARWDEHQFYHWCGRVGNEKPLAEAMLDFWK